MKKEDFLEEYVKAIRDGNAAVFAGAGLSRPSGFVNWKELLRPLAKRIGLDIEKEHDLTAVAQYISNDAWNRASINQTLIDAFAKDVDINDNIKILTKLPIYTYWTTNYDCLIETGLAAADRRPDVKHNSKQLPVTVRDRDAVVYKMHGDCAYPFDAILTKDDYAQYEKRYPLFREVLKGDLISKSFLFIGFSFDDPNLEHILNQIRMVLNENIRTHYCFMKKVCKEENKSDEEFNNARIKQDIRETELKRFGIQTIFVDEYSEITAILLELEKAVFANNVFISGSAHSYKNGWDEKKAKEFAFKLSNKLVANGFRVVSGYGLGIGSSVINGALTEIRRKKYKHLEEHLGLHPFPRDIEDEKEREKVWDIYRKEILKEIGIVVFIFGNKSDENGEITIADGCMKEFDIAKDQDSIIIPVGSTGGAAEEIYHKLVRNIEKYSYLEEYQDILLNSKDIDDLVQTVLIIAEKARKVL